MKHCLVIMLALLSIWTMAQTRIVSKKMKIAKIL